ncbi:MAG: hypothetical protein U0992_15790 [Planctomycetaceae bacterium]
MDSIPLSINGIRLSQVLFAPWSRFGGAIGYLKFKVTDPVYIVTNRSVQARQPLSRN